MGIEYSYTFSTGLTVKYGEKEKQEVEEIFEKEKERISGEEKKIQKEHGVLNPKFTWNNMNIGTPYMLAMQKYFKHEYFNEN